MRPKRKVLVIAYFFPPLGGGGIQRTMKFITYLRDFGWQPVVLTVKDGAWIVYDETIENQIPSDVPVYRIRCWIQHKYNLPQLTPSHWLTWFKRYALSLIYTPDEMIGWVIPAIWQGLRLIKKEQIDAIYTTAPPDSEHLIGLVLRQLTGKPWIADFRDSLVDLRLPSSPSWRLRLRRRFETIFRRVIIHFADHVIVANPYNYQFAGQLEYKCTKITNGYDETEFADLQPHQYNKFTILYTGTTSRSGNPKTFFQGLRLLLDKHPEITDQIQALFIGPDIEDQHVFIKKNRLQDNVVFLHPVPRKEILSYQKGANVLLLTVVATKKEGGEYIYPGKLFEYLGSQRPILTLALPSSAAAQVIHTCQAGVVVDYNDIEAISQALFTLYQQRDKPFVMQWDAIQKYERRNLTQKLAHVLDKVIT